MNDIIERTWFLKIQISRMNSSLIDLRMRLPILLVLVVFENALCYVRSVDLECRYFSIAQATSG